MVPMGDKVLVAVPGMWAPFIDASELEITSKTEGRIAVAGGYGSHGEPVRCLRKKSGKIAELWLSATRLVPESDLAAEMTARYERAPVSAKPPSKRRGASRQAR
jgi:D-alanyl-D-alanine carboxypeptidase